MIILEENLSFSTYNDLNSILNELNGLSMSCNMAGFWFGIKPPRNINEMIASVKTQFDKAEKIRIDVINDINTMIKKIQELINNNITIDDNEMNEINKTIQSFKERLNIFLNEQKKVINLINSMWDIIPVEGGGTVGILKVSNVIIDAPPKETIQPEKTEIFKQVKENFITQLIKNPLVIAGLGFGILKLFIK